MVSPPSPFQRLINIGGEPARKGSRGVAECPEGLVPPSNLLSSGCSAL